MRKYEAPELEVVVFENESMSGVVDVIFSGVEDGGEF